MGLDKIDKACVASPDMLDTRVPAHAWPDVRLPAVNDNLREVAWESLEGPYGPASEVPRLLQALRSEDSTVRVAAERQLEERHLEHQGLVCEPSAAAAPYLIDLPTGMRRIAWWPVACCS